MLAEPSLRQAAVALDDERTDDLVARLTRARCATTTSATRIAVETTAATVVRVALDRWADAREAGVEVDLLATFDAGFRLLRGLP